MKRAWVVATFGLLFTQAVFAQAWPERPIHLVVPFTPGGNVDVAARIVAQGMAEDLKQPVIVENKAGANAAIGAEFVARAKPDGYTALFATAETHALNPYLRKSLPYDPLKELPAVGIVDRFPFSIVVSPGVPAKDLRQFIDYAKANPGKLNFGTIATGSTQHLSAELFKLATGVQAPIVIYKTTPELVTAILRGDVDVGFDYYAAFGPSIVNKQFKVIATSGEQRSPQLPAVPTVKESGYPDFVVTSWNAIQGPAGVPKDIVTKLNEHIVAALKTPEIQARMGDLGIHPMIGSPEFLDERMKSEIAKWAKVIQAAGVEKQ